MSYWRAHVAEAGEIIWLHDSVTGGRDYKPRVHMPGQYNTAPGVDVNPVPIGPIATGFDFGRDASGKEYFVFAEYTISPDMTGQEVYIWKVTKPYNNPANWTRVLTKIIGSAESQLRHFHLDQQDPYTGIWYTTSGDFNNQIHWWANKNYGEAADGVELPLPIDQYNQIIYKTVGILFTKEYVYWTTDAAPDHALFHVAKKDDGLPDFATQVKLADLPYQSTIYMCLMHSPPGILLLDNLDNASFMDTFYIQFYSFEDNKIHTLAEYPTAFKAMGFTSCRGVTRYQGIYDTRALVGFSRVTCKMPFPYAETGRIRTLGMRVLRR